MKIISTAIFFGLATTAFSIAKENLPAEVISMVPTDMQGAQALAADLNGRAHDLMGPHLREGWQTHTGTVRTILSCPGGVVGYIQGDC